MISVISPAKTLDFESVSDLQAHSQPHLLKDAGTLIKILKKLTPVQVKNLMSISDKLAQLNVERYHAWKPPFDLSNARHAIHAFKGDVYLGLEAERFSRKELEFAQKQLRILSGLYGVLRPLDLMQPYRLEMGVKLQTPHGEDLYDFWGSKITQALNQALAENKSEVLVNLASNEYFKSVHTKALNAEVITPVFKDEKNGQYKVISFFAKKARGRMAAFIVKNRIKKARDLKDFAEDGYAYNEQVSSDKMYIFTRGTSGR